MLTALNPQNGIILITLIAGVVDDLRFRKVRNQIILVSFCVGIIYVISTQGFSGLLIPALSFATAFVLALPIYLMKVFGGGDYKLLMAISILMDWKSVVVTLAASLIFGAILGIIQVALKGQFKNFIHNIFALGQRVQIPEDKTHKIPFTIALLLGYLTSLFWGSSL